MLSSGSSPNSTWRGSQGLRASFSAKQKEYRPGMARVALSISPMIKPATLRTNRRSARPIVALARYPGPKQPESPLMPSCSAMGPLTITTGAAPPVVAWHPARLNGVCKAALTQATTTGKYSGRQPAITALIATFSMVTSELEGWATPRDSDGSSPQGPSIRRTASSVAGTTGIPSVHPCSS